MLAAALSAHHLAGAHREEIRECVRGGDVERAAKRLLDLARELRRNENTALLLASRLSQYKQRDRQLLADDRELLAIAKAILEEADTIFAAWTTENVSTPTPSQERGGVVVPIHQSPTVRADVHTAGTAPGQVQPAAETNRAAGLADLSPGWRDYGRHAESAPICQATDLRIAFRRRVRTFSLDGVNLTIFPGQITGVVGSNGSGKTTLLRALAGEIRPSEGQVDHHFGVGWHRESVADHIGYVEQSPKRWYGTLRGNLARWCSLRGLAPDESRRRIQFVLLRLDLLPFADHSWDELSGGYKTRFELARALLCMPKMLVLDEPLAPLDVRAQWLFLQDLRDIADSRVDPIGIVVSSQHLYEIEAIADDLIAIDDGNVLFSGPVEHLGDNRAENAFEIRASTSLDHVARVVRGIIGCRLEFNGRQCVLHTPREITGDTVLRHLLDARLDLIAFRDISRSSRRILFERK